MASSHLVFQGFTNSRHQAALRKLLEWAGTTAVYGSVAFVREDGVNAIRAALSAVGAKGKFFVGVRNEITSSQALECLLSTGVELYAVDTARRSVLFHPKAYLAQKADRARLLIGSANLTHSGLFNNVEFGATIDFDLGVPAEANEVSKFTNLLDGLAGRFPRHVIRVTPAVIKTLFDQGRLEDESVQIIVPPRGRVREGARDGLEAMKTPFTAPPVKLRKRVRVVARPAPELAAAPGAPALVSPAFELMWKSKGLTKRDLNIRKRTKTHITGSMLWKKGAFGDIDPRHFFRDKVFPNVAWTPDPKVRKRHLERSKAKFRIILKGIDLGVFDLKMTHNSKSNTKSYRQRNAMTQVHWGLLAPHIAKSDLLGRTMLLYRRAGNPPDFLIEID